MVQPDSRTAKIGSVAHTDAHRRQTVAGRAGKENTGPHTERRGRPGKNGPAPNRTDIALHWIYRSCLSRNDKDLVYALENVYNPIVYTTGEGFQHDNSYFQHGQQLYIGGYGDEILKGVTQVAMYTRGTRFAIPQDKLELLNKFMRETYYATIRGQVYVIRCLGTRSEPSGYPGQVECRPICQTDD